MRTPYRTGRHRSGYSLLELLAVIGIIGVLVGLTMSAVQRVRTSSVRAACLNNLRQLALAHQQYHAGHGKLPPGLTSNDSKDSFPYMSWHTRLLPYLEQDAVWKEAVAAFQVNPDFTRAPKHPGSSRSLAIFGCPSDPRTQSPQTINRSMVRGLTSYLGVAGTHADRQDGVLFIDSSLRIGDIADGTSNTLLIGERPPSANMMFGWWYAGWGQDRDGDADMVLGVRAMHRSIYAPECPLGPYSFELGSFTKDR